MNDRSLFCEGETREVNICGTNRTVRTIALYTSQFVAGIGYEPDNVLCRMLFVRFFALTV